MLIFCRTQIQPYSKNLKSSAHSLTLVSLCVFLFFFFHFNLYLETVGHSTIKGNENE